MSTTLSPIDAKSLEDLRREFGVVTSVPEINEESLEAASLAAHVRGLLAEATHQDKVSVTELARRLKVTKSAVSRHLHADGDMRLSTMAMFARALGRKFIVELRFDANSDQPKGNFFKVEIARNGGKISSESNKMTKIFDEIA